MGAQETGLTLEGLAKRLEALTEKVGGLESENAGLRQELSTLRASGAKGSAVVEGAAVGQDEGRMSRRALLTKAGAAAVAATTAGMLLTPREAQAAEVVGEGNPGVNGILTVPTGAAGVIGEVGDGITGDGVRGLGEGDGSAGVYGTNFDAGGYGVWGATRNGLAGVYGERNGNGGPGVLGFGDDGVEGRSFRNGYSGVYGHHTNSSVGPGVTGDGQGNWPGVWGRNPTADGVTGETSGASKSGVYGRHNGTSGFGVTGDGKGANGAGVLGRNGSGYGGLFEGGRAQLKLTPAGRAGRPGGAHAKGEIYMDSAANLFVCTKNGNPGTWRRVQTVAV